MRNRWIWDEEAWYVELLWRWTAKRCTIDHHRTICGWECVLTAPFLFLSREFCLWPRDSSSAVPRDASRSFNNCSSSIGTIGRCLWTLCGRVANNWKTEIRSEKSIKEPRRSISDQVITLWPITPHRPRLSLLSFPPSLIPCDGAPWRNSRVFDLLPPNHLKLILLSLRSDRLWLNQSQWPAIMTHIKVITRHYLSPSFPGWPSIKQTTV